MKQTRIIKFVTLFIALSVLSTGCTFIKNTVDPVSREMSSVIGREFESEAIFISLRSIGTDQFNIYSFSLDESDYINDFNKIDSSYHEAMEEKFSGIMETDFETEIESEESKTESNAFDVQQFYQNLSELEEDNETEYRYLADEETMEHEMYIYNKKLMKGYYLYLAF